MAAWLVQMMWPRGPHEMANKFNFKRHSKHQVQLKERDRKRDGERGEEGSMWGRVGKPIEWQPLRVQPEVRRCQVV